MLVRDTIKTKLNEAFAPARLDIEDESHLHAGHAGVPAGGESHFRVTIVSDSFTGQSRSERQRAVHRALKAELDGPVHALALHLIAPGESGAP